MRTAEPSASSPLKNSIRCATAVSAVRETSPLANFGTADTAVAHIFNRLLARLDNPLKKSPEASARSSALLIPRDIVPR